MAEPSNPPDLAEQARTRIGLLGADIEFVKCEQVAPNVVLLVARRQPPPIYAAEMADPMLPEWGGALERLAAKLRGAAVTNLGRTPGKKRGPKPKPRPPETA